MAGFRKIAAVISFMCFLCFTGPGGAAQLRVISLYPGHTDNIMAIGGTEFIVGVSENDGELPNLPRFSLKAGAESLLALHPDIVFTRSLAERMNPNLSDVLTRAGVRVVPLDPPSWDGFPDYLRQLAKVLGLDPESGVEKLYSIRGSIAKKAGEALASGMKAPRVFVEATSRDLRTCAPDSYAARLIELAGGINAAASAVPQREGSAVAPWGLERVLKMLDSGLDVYIVQSGTMNSATPDEVRSRPWAAALGGAELATVPEANLSRPSLLGLERGGEELLRIFYPRAAQNGEAER